MRADNPPLTANLMKLLHTSDWHLGHTLYDQSRELEHERFLDWLLDTLGSEEVDALIVAGDLFDTANPPAAAQADWYRFVAKARSRFPALDMVFIGGNHDSAARIDAPSPVFGAIGVRVVGGLPRDVDGEIVFDRLLVPLHEPGGRVAAWLAAIPYLRPNDLPAIGEEGVDPLVEGVRRIHDRVFAAARERLQPGQALLAAGHCYMVGTAISELSERKILGGNQHALPVDIFPDDVAYAALGHLHLAQSVGGRENIRYCGSPIPLSLAESAYRHQVCLVDLEEGRFQGVRSIAIPRAVEVLRLPEVEPLPLEEVLVLLASLPGQTEEMRDELRPYLEVRVRIDSPEPGLKSRIEAALEGKTARLMKLTVERTGHGQALADSVPDRQLSDLSPEQVFRNRYDREFHEPPPASLLEAFHELIDAAGQEDA